jgi:hypothetical protein
LQIKPGRRKNSDYTLIKLQQGFNLADIESCQDGADIEKHAPTDQSSNQGKWEQP